jgi:serine/threonine-protein kinase
VRCHQAQAWSAGGFGQASALHGDSLEATAFGLEEAGDLDGARHLFAAARQRYGDNPANRMRIGRVDSQLAGIDLLEGHPGQARARLPSAIADLRTRPRPIPPLIAEARLLLACTEAPGTGCPDDLQATVERDLAAAAPRPDPRLLWVRTLLAEVELRHGEPELARSGLAMAIENASGELPPAHPRQLAAQLWLAIATARSGDCAAASARARAARTLIEANRLASHPLLAGPEAMLRQPIATCLVWPN